MRRWTIAAVAAVLGMTMLSTPAFANDGGQWRHGQYSRDDCRDGHRSGYHHRKHDRGRHHYRRYSDNDHRWGGHGRRDNDRRWKRGDRRWHDGDRRRGRHRDRDRGEWRSYN